MKKYIYFDTSSINFIHKNVRSEDLFELKMRMIMEDNAEPVLSQLSLFEILCDSDERNMDELIKVCQLFFGKKIFPSLSELLENYCQFGFPNEDMTSLNFKSSSSLAKKWREVSDNIEKSLKIEQPGLKIHKQKMYKSSKILYKLVRNGFSDEALKNEDEIMILVWEIINRLYNSLLSIRCSNESINDDLEVRYKTNLFFVCYIFLILDSPYNNSEQFWKRKKIKSLEDRIHYIFENMCTLLFSGPTVAMTEMAMIQAKEKYERSFLMDCLHTGYLPYSKVFISNDNHFIEFGRMISEEAYFNIATLVDDDA